MSDNDDSGPSLEETTAKILSLESFRKSKGSILGVEQVPDGNQTWPQAVSKDEQLPVKVGTDGDPNKRRLLLSLVHGDIVVDGYLGLSNSFLAVGDAKGLIKFAAAPGMWLYARDCTDDEVKLPDAS